MKKLMIKRPSVGTFACREDSRKAEFHEALTNIRDSQSFAELVLPSSGRGSACAAPREILLVD